MSILQPRHTANTHHDSDNFHNRHDHNHNNAKEERRSSSSKKEKTDNYSEMSLHRTENARFLNNGDRLDEFLKELEGCKWGAVLLSETWENREK